MKSSVSTLIFGSMKRRLLAACAVALLPLAVGYSQPASATLTNCTDPANCGVTFKIGDTTIGQTNFLIGSKGALTLNVARLVSSASGWTVSETGGLSWSNANNTIKFDLQSQSALADPTIVFGYSVTNSTNSAVAFSANQFLPIKGLSGTIATHSELNTTVVPNTSLVSAGSVIPTSGTGFIADSEDLRSLPAAQLDKKVDIGTACTKTSTGACTETPKNGTIVLDGTFDTMNVDVGFQVSPQTVGQVAGLVSQNVVPEPGTYGLLVAGLIAVGFVTRRRINT